MKSMKMRKTEQGFTIIELVVVILLLGILTATALPRFMDVTDEAHESVVNAVQGGLNTSLALYRAEWFAKRQPKTVKGDLDASAMYVHSNGFPIGLDSTLNTMQDCIDMFNILLQENGRPTIAKMSSLSGSFASIGTSTTTVGLLADADFGVHLDSSSTPGTCSYVYVGQYKNLTDGSVHVLTYSPSTGKITRGKK